MRDASKPFCGSQLTCQSRMRSPVTKFVLMTVSFSHLGSNLSKYFDVKRKKVDYKTVIECVKESNILIGLKKTCLGVLDRGDRNKNNETSLKEGGGIEMSTTVLHSRATPSLKYSPFDSSTITYTTAITVP